MNPTVRYDLRPGEWRQDPPHVAYGCDRSGLVELLEAELSAAPWASGESDEGPVVEVAGRTLACPPSREDVEWLVGLAEPAPYGRGEETLLDPAVRDALQVSAEQAKLEGPGWKRLRARMLRAIAREMGLRDRADLCIELYSGLTTSCPEYWISSPRPDMNAARQSLGRGSGGGSLRGGRRHRGGGG